MALKYVFIAMLSNWIRSMYHLSRLGKQQVYINMATEMVNTINSDLDKQNIMIGQVQTHK